MARSALYMGPRLKRVRRDLGLTQANMAADLDISPSYVALMERNQRPVTAELLLRLARTYHVDIGALAEDGGEELAARLGAVLREPIFADIDLPALDVADIATSYPGFAEALLRLHTAYGEERLELAQRRETGAGEGVAGPALSNPVAEARTFLAARRNCFPRLEDSAAAVAEGVPGQGQDALVRRFEERHGLRVLFVEPDLILGAQRFHDLHRRQLMISKRLDHPSRRFQLALQLALLEADGEIGRLVSEGAFTSDNARRMARRALAGYWAAALLMPYRPFLRAARQTRYDVEALSREFGVSFEQAAHRLTTLQRAGEEGVPFFFIRLDAAGNVSKRLDGAGFPFARHGGACPLWTVHSVFQTPGRIVTQRLELPDGERFFSIARTVSAGGGAWGAPVMSRAVALACAEEHISLLVYGEGAAAMAPTPIGIACHLCHRPRCLARAAPPLGRDLRSDDYRDTGIPFAFAGD
ncbi:putative Xre family transcriptional regulator [Sphingobium sp. SYK-6]|uniref:helix-turn-helix domain-containing protein n=1 Tax=Sphingobium sp. (strain NBRC 103272 / SYK-6) TaxID=627192 RepID=UPI0002276D7B|nr:helix-turn-helix transcriptional regulator [Sphingobium sp. SYK-6]BAK65607.1 putative Xre family transcriptional regulator [Sphingobium sp. SYK-6]